MLVELDVIVERKGDKNNDEELEDLDIELEMEGRGGKEENENHEVKTISVRHDLVLMVQPHKGDQSVIFFGEMSPAMRCKHSRKAVHKKLNKAIREQNETSSS